MIHQYKEELKKKKLKNEERERENNHVSRENVRE